MGQATIPIVLGNINFLHPFTVVKQLSVPGILGADFLVQHKATIDCNAGTLWLGDNQATIPIQFYNQPQGAPTVHNVVATSTQEIPGRCVKFIMCIVKGVTEQVPLEGLIEPSQSGSLSKHLMVGRSLNIISQQQDVTIPVLNTSPSPVKIYKGARIASLTPRHEVFLLEQEDCLQHMPNNSDDSHVDVELGPELTDQEKGQIHALLTEFTDVFATVGGPLGHTDIIKHTIRTNGAPIRQPPRRLPQSLKPVVTTEVSKMLDQGVVRHSNSPWSSPIVMVQKKDGTWRFCVDYRKVNSMTQRDAYPLPRIDETLDSLVGAKYFTTLDLASGYWQVEVEEDDKKKTAFSTPHGHYEFNVMPFGLTNAPGTFQRLMECILSGLT